MTDVFTQFQKALLAAGLTVPDAIYGDGTLHRFSSNGKPRDKAGWYVLHLDGAMPAGAFGCWRSGVAGVWSAKPESVMTKAERDAFRHGIQAARALRDAEIAKSRQAAASEAKAFWEQAAPPSPAHPYLVCKGIKPHGLRQIGGVLYVPVWQGKQLVSLQKIHADGSKRFLKGGAMRAGACFIGQPKDGEVLCIAEGFATGASIHEATGYAVCVAFNAGNLSSVAQAMRNRFADSLILICGDDDTSTPCNPGRKAAKEAALACGGAAVFPIGVVDFNDLHQTQGLSAVALAISEAVQAMGGKSHE